MSHSHNKIGKLQGIGLLATTLLGSGVFILPQLTLDIAGNSAFWSWILLTLTIIPVAFVFGQLAAKFPHVGGPAHFVETAFGKVAGRTMGMIFLLVVPIGAPAGLMLTFQFVTPLIDLPGIQFLLAQLFVLLVLFIINVKGIQVSARLQLGLTVIMTALVVILCVALGVSDIDLVALSVSDFEISASLAAMAVAFWCFLGIEAITHLSGDFASPKTDLVPAMLAGVLVVGAIYLGCTLLILTIPAQDKLAMITVFDTLLGGNGALVIGILGIAGGLASVNVYVAGLSRLMCSFSKDGVLPRFFARENQHRVPVTALGTLLSVMALALTLRYIFDRDLEELIAWCNGVFVIMYLGSMLSAFKLLDKRHRYMVCLSCLFCLIMIWGLGWQMLYALVLVIICAPLLWWQASRKLTDSNQSLTTAETCCRTQ